MGRYLVGGTLIALAAMAAVGSPACLALDHKSFKGVTEKIVVRANARACYEAIRALRNEKDSGVRVLSASEDRAVLEETFEKLPIIGEAVCTYEERYDPCKSIEYKMLKSNRFKAFEGAWHLSPAEDGRGTVVQLSSYVDAGLPVPFARQITNMQTAKDIHERLHAVKSSAEEHRVSSSGQSAGGSDSKQ